MRGQDLVASSTCLQCHRIGETGSRRIDTLVVQDVGRTLGVRDSDLNYETAVSALRALARARDGG